MRRAGDCRLPPTCLLPVHTHVFTLAVQGGSGTPTWGEGPLVLGNMWEVWGVLCSICLGIGWRVTGKLEKLQKVGCLETQKSLPCYFFSVCQIFIRQMLSYPAASCRDSGHLLVARWFTWIRIILGTTCHRGLRGSEKVLSSLFFRSIALPASFLPSHIPFLFLKGASPLWIHHKVAKMAFPKCRELALRSQQNLW